MKNSSITPTDEQEAALNAFKTGQAIRLLAFAGAGKTTTLSLLAHSSPAKGIYITFSKSIADAARGRFPSTVDCSTTHSIAWKAVKKAGGFSNGKLVNRVFPNQLADLLGLDSRQFGKSLTLRDRQQAHLILTAIRNYCHSADEELSPEHVSLPGILKVATPSQQEELSDWVAHLARRTWGLMITRSHSLPMGHDGYQKLWGLSHPVLKCDYLLLDEAQDTNEVVLGVLREQSCQVVSVGDPYQQIYEWRGAVNAMDRLTNGIEVALTQSFRFGATIAEAATAVLRRLGETRTIQGNPHRQSQLLHDGPARTILAKTNLDVFKEVLAAQKDELRVCVLGGTRELSDLLEDVKALQKSRPAKQPELFGFRKWSEVEEFSEKPEGRELRVLVGLTKTHRLNRLQEALGKTVQREQGADRIISTAHKAKGREWPDVRLSPGFTATSKKGARRLEDVRLFYVALTRASERVIVPEKELKFFQSEDPPALSRSA